MSTKAIAACLVIMTVSGFSSFAYGQRLVQLAALEEDVRIRGEMTEDSLGYALAYADIDQDGFEDIIIGAPYANPSQRFDAGIVYIIYGDAGFTPPHQTIELPNPTGNPGLIAHDITIVAGAVEGDGLGRSVGTGDVDGDGFPDVIIGAPFADSKSRSDPAATDDTPSGGKTYVIYSIDPSGASLKSIVNLDLATPPADRVTEINGGADNFRIGWSVASSDVDQDDSDEVIIGAPFADRALLGPGSASRPEAGITYVVDGVLPRLPAGHVALADPLPVRVSEILGENNFDHSGWSVAGANLNGDDAGEVIIGAPLADVAFADEGKTYVISGTAGVAIPSPFDLATPPAPIVSVSGANGDERSGWAVASGLVLNRGFADLIIGAPFRGSATGVVYVFYGDEPEGTELLTPGSSFSVTDAGTATPGLIIGGGDKQDLCGWSVGSGDISDDGLDDILMGAPQADRIGAGPITGEAYAIFSEKARELFDAGIATTDITNADVVIFGDDPNDLAGFSVAAGDLNANDSEDFGVGAPGADVSDFDDGEVYIIYGCKIDADFTFTPENPCAGEAVTFTDMSTSGLSGIAAWLWDLDGDGVDDSNISNPVFTYTIAGTFRVTLTVTDSVGCVSSIEKEITVNPLPVADFTFRPDFACLGEEMQFMDTSVSPGSAIVSWSWDFDTDGVEDSNLQNPTHVYTSAGIFTVTLTVENENGCAAKTTKTITVRPLPTADFNFTPETACVGDRVQFTDASTSVGGAIVMWSWDFDGDGVEDSNLQNPTHTYTASGTFTVMLEVDDVNGCSGSVSKEIIIAEAVAAFTATPDTVCLGEEIQFTDASSSTHGVIVSWSWDFDGDGVEDSDLQNPIHTYTTAGTFTVVLTVEDSDTCTARASRDITVDPLPVADFTFVPEMPCVGDPVQFTDASTSTDGEIVSWSWDFDGDGVEDSDSQNPAHAYTSAGDFMVTLTVENENGCEARVTKPITVSQATADFTFTPPNPCVGDTVRFTDASSSTDGTIVSWSWDLDGDGVEDSNLQNPTHTYDSAGDFMVTLSVEDDDSCKASVTKTLAVGQATADFTFTPPNPCVGDTVRFTDASSSTDGTIVSWSWDLDGDGVEDSNLQNPTHTYGAAGSYLVTLSVADDDSCKASVTKTITVSQATADFTFTPANPCVGDVVQFTDASNSTDGVIVSWSWDFDGDGIEDSNLQNPTHTYGSAGIFMVTLAIADDDSCKASVTREINVIEPPTAAFDPPDGSQFCMGQIIQFTDLSAGSITDWLWDFDGEGSSDLQNPQFSFTTTGIKEITLIISNDLGTNACFDTLVQQIEIIEAPTAGFSFRRESCAEEPVQFRDESGPVELISRWDWDFGDGSPGVTVTNPPAENGSVVHTYANVGTYDVTLIITIAKNTGDVSDSLTKRITILPADNVAPLCSFIVDENNNVIVDIADNESGISSVTIIEVRNGTVRDERNRFDWSDGSEKFGAGINRLKLIVTPINRNRNVGFTIEIRDFCQNLTRCDPVVLTATGNNDFENEFILPQTDKFLYVSNRGLERIDITINGQVLEMISDPVRRDRALNRQYMPSYGDVSLDVQDLLTEEQNQVFLFVTGSASAAAQVIFADVQFPASSSPLPQSFSLYQNYPNPFNPSTTIEFTVPESAGASSVELILYNIFGQRVKKLVDEVRQPGAYAVVWDGTDENGAVASTGAYFYRIKMGDFTATKRMMFVK